MTKEKQKFLEVLRGKHESLITTSNKFKEELTEYFSDYQDKTIVEVGCAFGDTTALLSVLFNKVYTINDTKPSEQPKERTMFIEKEIIQAQPWYIAYDVGINLPNYKFDNITYVKQNAYNEKGWSPVIKNVDVSFIDCVHNTGSVKHDVEKSIENGAKTIVFDDYGLFTAVQKGVDELVQDGILKVEKKIGLEPGEHKLQNGNRTFNDYEGIICSVV